MNFMGNQTRMTRTKHEVLQILAEYFVLRSTDVAQLLRKRTPTESDLRSVQHTLLLLDRAGLVNRLKFLDLQTDIAWYAYGLSGQGVKEFGGKALDDHSKRTIDHELEISRFHIASQEFCNTNGLTLYWQQTDLKKKGIHPDAYFKIKDKHFFLEIERQRIIVKKGKATIKTKLDRYYDLYDTPECEGEWGFRQFRVVTIHKSDSVREHVLPLLPKNRMFWCGTCANLLGNFKTPKGDTCSFSDLFVNVRDQGANRCEDCSAVVADRAYSAFLA